MAGARRRLARACSAAPSAPRSPATPSRTERYRQHADDFPARCRSTSSASDDTAIAAEDALPEAVRDDRDPMLTGDIVPGAKRATDGGRHAKDVEELRSDRAGADRVAARRAPVSVTCVSASAAMCSNGVWRRRQSRKSAGATTLFSTFSAGRFSQTITSDPGRDTAAAAVRRRRRRRRWRCWRRCRARASRRPELRCSDSGAVTASHDQGRTRTRA